MKLEAVRACYKLPPVPKDYSSPMLRAIESDEAAIAKVLAEKDAEIERLREAMREAATDMDTIAVADCLDGKTYGFLKQYAAKIDAVLGEDK